MSSPVHRPSPFLVALLALAGSLAPRTATAQSALQFLEEAREAYEARMEGIQSYQVIAAMAGMEHTTRYVRSEADGVVIFLPEDSGEGGRFDQGFLFRPDVARRMRVEGNEDAGGARCRVLVLDDFEGLDFVEELAGRTERFEPKSMQLCMDDEAYLLRRMAIEGSMTMMGEAREVTNTLVFSDYRDVEGLMYPFHVEMTVSGLPAAAPGQPDQAAAIEQLRQQMDQVPEAQRKALEDMLERLEAMQGMAPAGGANSMVIETRSVEVERGPGE
jgi:hypothetical protein